MSIVIQVIGDSISEGAGSILKETQIPDGLIIKGPKFGWVLYLGLMLITKFKSVTIINNSVGAQGPRYFWYCLDQPAYDITIVETVRFGEDKYLYKLLSQPNTVQLALDPDVDARKDEWSTQILQHTKFKSFKIVAHDLYKKYISSDNVHPNDEGHHKIAESVQEFILDHKHNFSHIKPLKKNTHCYDANNMNAIANGYSLEKIVNQHNCTKYFWRSNKKDDVFIFRSDAEIGDVYIVLYTHSLMSSLSVSIGNTTKILDPNINFKWLQKGRGLPCQFYVSKNIPPNTSIIFRNMCTNSCESQINGILYSDASNNKHHKKTESKQNF